MVMEATPSPQSVGREFVRQYYTLLNKAPAHLHRFYNNCSSFVHGGLDAPNHETLPVIGQKQIHNRIQQLNFRDCHAKISQVDSQATLGNGVVVQVTGELSNGGAPMRRFTQTFVLAAQSPKMYYVHNDIFRYQDMVFSEDECEEDSGSVRGGEGGMFPPAPAFPPASAVPPPQQQMNGHPDPTPSAEQIAATMHGASMSPSQQGQPMPMQQQQQMEQMEPMMMEPDEQQDMPNEYESELAQEQIESEPEPEPEPEPHQHYEVPIVSNEPKTYANLLKSGNTTTANVVYAPPQQQPQRPARTSSMRNDSLPPENIRKYNDSQQLFLGNVPPNASEEDLRGLFGRFGAIAELRIHGKASTGGRYNNYGFITYEEPQAAHNCLNAGPLYFPPDSTDGSGTKLNVEEKRPRTGGPRSDRGPNDRDRGGERGGGERGGGGRGRRPPFGASRNNNNFRR